MLALSLAAIVLAQAAPAVPATPAPAETPWLSIVIAVLTSLLAIVKALQLGGFIPGVTTPPGPIVTPPADPSQPPVVVVPPGPAPSPVLPTVAAFIQQLLADGAITWADAPAVIDLVTKLLAGRLNFGVTPEAQLAVIRLIASRKMERATQERIA